MKIGVIGLGSIGMRHARNLNALGHEVRGQDPQGSVWPPILWDEDAYIVSSPTSNHFEHLCDIRRLNERPSFVEKPIAETIIQANAIGTTPATIAMVGYNLRFHSSVKTAKEWLAADKIGKPLWATFTCAQFNDKPAYLRDGVILNWSHEIDLALYLLGHAHVEASSTRIVDGHDDMTDILLTHVSGCRTHIHLDYLTKPEMRSFIISGTKGRITGSLLHRNAFWIANNSDQSGLKVCPKSYDDDYVDEMKAFIERVEGKEAIGCTAAEALEVLDICLEVRRQAGL